MANKIQIKRSNTAAAPTSNLAVGELAYTTVGGILFIGDPSGSNTSLAIGGLRAPGVLTANQALVANSSSAINQVIAGQVNAITTSAVGANVVANTSAYFVGNSSVNTFITQNLLDLGGQINANASVGSAGQVLVSGGAGNVYWTNQVVDTNTTYDLLAVANGVANEGIIRLDPSSADANDDVKFVGANGIVVSSNSSVILITGQIDTDTNTTYDLLSVANTTVGVITLDPSTGANDDIRFIGAGSVTVTSDASGNVTITGTDTNTTYDLLHVANTTQGVITLQPSAGANDNINFIGLDEIAITSNTTAVIIDHADVARSNNTSTASPASGGTFTAIDSISTNARGHVTAINTKTVTLPVDPDTNTTYDLLAVANVAVNEGIIRLDPSSADANDDIKFVGANGVIVSSNSTAILITGQIDTNTTYDLVTIANTTVGVVALDPSTGANDDVRFVGANGIIVTSDAVGNVIISTNSGGNGTFNNLIVSGNLTVSGTFTQFDVETLTVEDPLVELSRTQANTVTFLDAVDIGFYGQYGNTANVVYTGLFRDASATDRSFKLFSGQIPAPGATVDTANVNFGYANLTLHSLLGGNASSTIDLFTIDGGTF